MKHTPISRRDFLKNLGIAGAGTLLAASPWLSAFSEVTNTSNEKCRLAIIGPGSRGRFLMGFLAKNPKVEIVALCDIYKPSIESALELVPNANRKFCTKYGISTSFVRKGRAAKDEPLRKVLRSELSKERATRLEGSFGTQKQHYSLSRIKARNRKTEILWIFFGIHTANAILIIEKIRNKTAKAA